MPPLAHGPCSYRLGSPAQGAELYDAARPYLEKANDSTGRKELIQETVRRLAAPLAPASRCSTSVGAPPCSGCDS